MQTSIPYSQFLNPAGELLKPLPQSLSDNADLLPQMYRNMVLTRLFDQKAVALQRTGQLGTYPSCLGQEAIGVAIGHAMTAADVFAPYYRDQATQFIRGVALEESLLYWGGDERGNCFKTPKQDLPNCVPISTQLPHAMGIATAIKMRKEKRAVVVTCGDGATSRGDFYEAINLAGVWHLPVVIVINNNQWAISVPRQLQTAAETLAQKGFAAGISAEQVDGNDIIAVYHAVEQALQKAHSGKGPTLIEALSYRLTDHTTADDATRYRTKEELEQQWPKEPVKRLQTYLHQQGLWNETKEQNLIKECNEHIKQAVDRYLAIATEPAEAIFDYLHAELPNNLIEQRAELMEKAARLEG